MGLVNRMRGRKFPKGRADRHSFEYPSKATHELIPRLPGTQESAGGRLFTKPFKSAYPPIPDSVPSHKCMILYT